MRVIGMGIGRMMVVMVVMMIVVMVMIVTVVVVMIVIMVVVRVGGLKTAETGAEGVTKRAIGNV